MIREIFSVNYTDYYERMVRYMLKKVETLLTLFGDIGIVGIGTTVLYVGYTIVKNGLYDI